MAGKPAPRLLVLGTFALASCGGTASLPPPATAPPRVAAADYARKVAVVVAINDYAGPTDLTYAVPQASRVAAELRARGFHVHERFSPPPTADDVRDMLRAIAPTVGTDGLLVVYFAGHGRTEATKSGPVGYLVGADKRDVGMDELLRIPEMAGAPRHVFFVLDACFSGIVFTAPQGVGGPVTETMARDAVQALTAGKDGEVAHDGVMTRAFLDALTGGRADLDGDGYVTGQEVCRHVSREVTSRSRGQQNPQCGWLTSGTGDVAFRALSAASTFPPAPPPEPEPPPTVAPPGPSDSQARERQRRWNKLGVLRRSGQLPDAALLDNLRKFMGDYPEGNPFLPEATRLEADLLHRLEKADAEGAWWRAASAYKSGSMTARDKMATLTDYLSRYPGGRHERDAMKWIKALKSRAAEEERSESIASAWRAIPDPIPDDTTERRAARDQLSAFLHDYPRGNPYRDRAYKLIASIDADEKREAAEESRRAAEARREAERAAEEQRRARQAATPTPQPAPREARDGMVFVPAGAFFMGCNTQVDNECNDVEKPGRTVNVGAFRIDRTEVTVDAYGACVRAGRCAEPDTGGSCNWGNSGRGDHPINCVNWNDAKAYCGWAGKRLPTEAEWEKAARGTDGRKYPWGNEAPDHRLANFGRNVGGTASVDSYGAGASPYGALNMAGNVWEWVEDAVGSNRVLRGGSLFNGTGSVRASLRFWYGPANRSVDVGFRCVSHQ